MKTSAWRRNSSAIIGGWLEIVETTVTRTPRRCTASASERKSPSPENSWANGHSFHVSAVSGNSLSSARASRHDG